MKYVLFCLCLAWQIPVQSANAALPVGPQPDSMTVYIFLRVDCNICEFFSVQLNQLYEEYDNDQISFMGIFPNFSSKPPQIEAFKKKYQVNFPTQTDYHRQVTDQFGATVTPEVVVYNEAKKQVVYQGRIDNTYYQLGRKRSITTVNDLENVLQSVTKNSDQLFEHQSAIGCFIERSRF